MQAFFNFDTFIFPKITTAIYWIGMAVIVLAGVVGIIAALIGGNLLGALAALVLAVIGLVVWRVTIELWMVLFSIHDVLRDIRDQRRAA